jgi:predicted O-methyltransferase YrrM
MEQIVQTLHETFKDELDAIRREFSEKIGNTPCSTSVEDCLFLYTLIRFFKPKTILEIGTFVGSTLFSIVRACENNGTDYKIYTIDLENNLTFPFTSQQKSHITFFHEHSDKSLSRISDQLDFVFSDADLTVESASILSKLVKSSTVFATHDFVPPFDKGITSLLNMFIGTCLRSNDIIVPNSNVNWIYSRKNQESIHDDFSRAYLSRYTPACKTTHSFSMNGCIAVIFPSIWRQHFKYSNYFTIDTLFVRGKVSPPYFYDEATASIILNNIFINNKKLNKRHLILSQLENGIPTFKGVTLL